MAVSFWQKFVQILTHDSVTVAVDAVVYYRGECPLFSLKKYLPVLGLGFYDSEVVHN